MDCPSCTYTRYAQQEHTSTVYCVLLTWRHRMSLPSMLQDAGETRPVSYPVKGYLMQWYNSLLTRWRFFPCPIAGCPSLTGSCFVPCGLCGKASSHASCPALLHRAARVTFTRGMQLAMPFSSTQFFSVPPLLLGIQLKPTAAQGPEGPAQMFHFTKELTSRP